VTTRPLIWRTLLVRPGYVKLGFAHLGWCAFEGNLHLSLAWIRGR
jgi:hypothetical protein